MKAGGVLIIASCVAILGGCNAREKELEETLQKEQTRFIGTTDSLNQVIAQRDKYFDEVVRSINDIYSSLEGVRKKEAMISQQAGEAEGKFSLTNEQARSTLLQQIASIGTTLEDNRKKIAGLQSRVKKLNKEFASLNETIINLKQMIEEREKTIAMLETRVSGLEGQVEEKSRLIADRDAIIGSQETRLNTVYYVAGTRDELEEKGIIKDEGGFPWGLFGSTTVLASGIDQSYFKAFDRNGERVIKVDGRIDEIVPKRSDEYYALNQIDDATADLNITDPTRFWQDRYLVIITE